MVTKTPLRLPLNLSECLGASIRFDDPGLPGRVMPGVFSGTIIEVRQSFLHGREFLVETPAYVLPRLVTDEAMVAFSRR